MLLLCYISSKVENSWKMKKKKKEKKKERKENGNGAICSTRIHLSLPPSPRRTQTIIEIRSTWNPTGERDRSRLLDPRASWKRNLNFESYCAIPPTHRCTRFSRPRHRTWDCIKLKTRELAHPLPPCNIPANKIF